MSLSKEVQQEKRESQNPLDAKASRRTVMRWGLRAAAVAAGALAVSAEMPKSDQAEKLLSTPESIHGVDVYGLREKIAKQDQLDELYQHFDYLFEEKLPEHVRQKDRFEQRDYLLNPNERYLELVVRQSVYQQFLDGQGEPGVDYVDYMRMHVDALNRCMENAKPPSSLQAKLLRIIVVDDSFVTNPSKYSKDMDAAWFSHKFYRFDKKKEKIHRSFWSFYQDKDENVIFRWPPVGDKIETKYTYPPKQDSLTGKDGVWLGFGLAHEWSHLLLNLPDEYTFNTFTESSRFKQFFFDTGSFAEPWLSPNLSYLLQRNQAERIRGYYTHPKGIGVVGYRETGQSQALRPKDIRIECLENNKPIEGTASWYVARYKGDYYSWKSFPSTPDQEGEGVLELDQNLFNAERNNDGDIIYPQNFLLRIIDENINSELHFPAAAFNMSKIAGIDQANYKINFTGYDDSSKKTQVVKLVDESDLEGFLNVCKETGDQPYAQMKVDGTSTTFFWLLRDSY